MEAPFVADEQMPALISELFNHLAALDGILQLLFGEAPAALSTAERRLAARLIREVRQWISEVDSQRARRSCVIGANTMDRC